MHYYDCISLLVTMYEETGILKDYLMTKIMTKRFILSQVIFLFILFQLH